MNVSNQNVSPAASPRCGETSSTGRVHSIQSMGTVDGPGVRFVIFFQGCHLRCKCCHNPDTWNMNEGTVYTAEELVRRAARFREYFGTKGGITLSGGEPLLQPKFAHEIFVRCHEAGINTCLDTSGSLWNDDIQALLEETDRVLLDWKYTDDTSYREHVGCHLAPVEKFLSYLNAHHIPVTLRQVIIPTINDTVENVQKLKAVADQYPCVDKVELLPFRTICQTKYDSMGLTFPFGHLPSPTAEDMAQLNAVLQ